MGDRRCRETIVSCMSSRSIVSSPDILLAADVPVLYFTAAGDVAAETKFNATAIIRATLHTRMQEVALEDWYAWCNEGRNSQPEFTDVITQSPHITVCQSQLARAEVSLE